MISDLVKRDVETLIAYMSGMRGKFVGGVKHTQVEFKPFEVGSCLRKKRYFKGIPEQSLFPKDQRLDPPMVSGE